MVEEKGRCLHVFGLHTTSGGRGLLFTIGRRPRQVAGGADRCGLIGCLEPVLILNRSARACARILSVRALMSRKSAHDRGLYPESVRDGRDQGRFAGHQLPLGAPRYELKRVLTLGIEPISQAEPRTYAPGAVVWHAFCGFCTRAAFLLLLTQVAGDSRVAGMHVPTHQTDPGQSERVRIAVSPKGYIGHNLSSLYGSLQHYSKQYSIGRYVILHGKPNKHSAGSS